MILMPMLYVNPVTGPYAGQRMVCYVCQYGSEPVAAVFLKPATLEEPGMLEAVQALVERHPALRAFVVCLSGPDAALEERLRTLAREKGLTVPLTVLPDRGSEVSIYQAICIRRSARVTVLLYKGRQVVRVAEDLHFVDDQADLTATPAAAAAISVAAAATPAALEAEAEAEPEAGATAAGGDVRARVEASRDFRELDAVAAAMVEGA